MIGGGLETNTWDKVDALWKTVEAPLRDRFTLTAEVKFDTSDPQLVHQNVKYISTVARGNGDVSVSALRPTMTTEPMFCFSSVANVDPLPSSYCGADKQRGLCGPAAGGRAPGSDERRLRLLTGAAF